MADVRPFPAIRYAPDADLAALVTPPFDVISPAAQAAYYARSPHNIIRLELGRGHATDDDLDNRYTRAAATFADWRLHGIMRQDAPSLYLYEQRFASGDADYRRLSLLARVRLEPWEAGVVLPHERTLSKPKADRLQLMRATAANFSPLMVLYDDPDAQLAAVLDALSAAPPAVDFSDEAGEGHRLWVLPDPALAERVAAFFRERQLYIADGHHRYETGLAYRDEQSALRKAPLAPDDAANFTLMALSAIEDPGLLVLPTHRVLHAVTVAHLAARDEHFREHFALRSLGPLDETTALAALNAGQRGGETVFVLARPEGMALLTLTVAGHAAMGTLAGEQYASASPAWRQLDLAALHALVLDAALGITPEMVTAGEHVSFTRDAAAALADVAAGRAAAALLVNPTPPAAIRDVARAGDRMPQKSTYFYPKLITGLTINPLW
ncbi:MAG: DUF1015 domain-containing protein [Ktedonobacterales bacterium]